MKYILNTFLYNNLFKNKNGKNMDKNIESLQFIAKKQDTNLNINLLKIIFKNIIKDKMKPILSKLYIKDLLLERFTINGNFNKTNLNKALQSDLLGSCMGKDDFCNVFNLGKDIFKLY